LNHHVLAKKTYTIVFSRTQTNMHIHMDKIDLTQTNHINIHKKRYINIYIDIHIEPENVGFVVGKEFLY